MDIGSQLKQAAIKLIETRYPVGWGGCAALRLASGAIVTSVAPDTELDALSLCMEVGSVLEAHKRDDAVTHSLCICRSDESSDFKVLSPCGICQERLLHWGGDVLVAVTHPSTELLFKPIRVLQPFHWSTAYGHPL